MVRYFFEHTDGQTGALFTETAIMQDPTAIALQGAFPVISLSFRNITETSERLMYKRFAYTIAQEFERHASLLTSNALQEHEKERYTRLRQEKGTDIDLRGSLEFLAHILYKVHGKRVVVLIDEYDVPVQTAYLHGFYEPIVDFMRSLLAAVLKDQQALERGALTGILALAKADIFSGLNNLEVFNVTRKPLADKFGFTKQEVMALLAHYDLSPLGSEITKWYDGYACGAKTGLYNPWSVLNCIRHDGALEKYWAHTSDNALVKQLIAQAPVHIKQELERLLLSDEIMQPIEDSITFSDVAQRSEVIWSLLLFTGYLTFASCTIQAGKKICALTIPNKEIYYLYEELITALFKESLVSEHVYDFLTAFVGGNGELVQENIQQFVMSSMSAHDLPETEVEKSYHLFMLGLLVLLKDRYHIRSNRESGLGRYDVMLQPRNTDDPGIIIEFKRIRPHEDLHQSAQQALLQVSAKQYQQELQDQGIQNIITYGIAFRGKAVQVAVTRT